MISHARRALAVVAGRDWLAAMRHGTKTQEGVAKLACSWSARRTILTSSAVSAPPQFHTAASRKAPFTALPLPASYPEETSAGRHLGESMTKAGRDVTERVVAGIQGALALAVTAGTRASQALEAWQVKREAMVKEGYLQYLSSLSDGRMLTDELRHGFERYMGGSWERRQYGPWGALLQRLFPDAFGYAVSLEKVVKETFTLSDGETADLEHWFLVVRRGRRVRLLATGFGATTPGDRERSFAQLMSRLEPMPGQLTQRLPADAAVPWLAFCGQDFCWGEIRGGSSLRLGQISRVQADTGEPTLFQLAQHIHSL